MSPIAFAADTTHWVDISIPTQKIYLDDSDVIVEKPYNGFKVLIMFGTPSTKGGHNNIISEIVVVEYDCHAKEGRAKRLVYFDTSSVSYDVNEIWIKADHSPATEIVDAVKARVCFHTLN